MAYTGIRPGRSQGKMKTFGNPNNLAGSAATGYRATGAMSAPAATPKAVTGGGALSQFTMPEAPKGPSVGRQIATVAGTKLATDLVSKGAGQLYDSGAKYIADQDWFGDGNNTAISSAPALPQSSAADWSGSGAQSFEVSDPGAGIEEIPMTENFGDDVGGFSSYSEPASAGGEILDTSAATADDGSWLDLFDFANGGQIPGHTIGVDGVPIQADGGEYMIPTDVVDQLGPEFFETLVSAFHKPVPGKPPTRTALSGMHAMPDGSMMKNGMPMANGGAISKMHSGDDYPSPLRFGRR